MSSLDSSSTYTPIYHPIQPHRSLKLTPSLSTRKAHFRRLYDIYQIAVQRNDLLQAKKAYAILVRCKEFDWAANWRSGLEMVNFSEDNHNDDSASFANGGGDITLTEERMRIKEKRLILLKIDYLRECHIIHSRKARKKHSLREPEAILLQIVLLLAWASKHAEALNELELYLPVTPYRDNALLHYYAGLLCLYLAQIEVLQSDTMSSQNLLAASGGNGNIGSGSSNGYPGYTSSSQGQLQYGMASSSSAPSTPGMRSRASSTSSSNSSDSSSSSSDAQNARSKHPFASSSHSKSLHASSSSHSQNSTNTYHKSFNQSSRVNIKDALQFSHYPTPEFVKKIMQSVNGMLYVSDARKWLELSKRISEEKGSRFDDVDEWLGLLNGQSVEETKAIRKLDLLKETPPSQSRTPPASRTKRPASTIRSSASTKRKSMLSSSSSARKVSRLPSSSVPTSASESHNGSDNDSDTYTIPPLTAIPTSSRTMDSDNIEAAEVGSDDDDDEDEDDDDDPFGRSKSERKKRKRNHKMVTFASIDEAFDLSMSD